MTFLPPESFGDPLFAISHLEAICALILSGVGHLEQNMTFWYKL